jgi:hypothetical protein
MPAGRWGLTAAAAPAAAGALLRAAAGPRCRGLSRARWPAARARPIPPARAGAGLAAGGLSEAAAAAAAAGGAADDGGGRGGGGGGRGDLSCSRDR